MMFEHSSAWNMPSDHRHPELRMPEAPGRIYLEQTVVALESELRRHAELEQGLRQRVKEMATLNALGRELAADLSLEGFAIAVHRGARLAVEVDEVWLLLLHPERLLPEQNAAAPRHAAGAGMDRIAQVLCGLVARGGRAIYSEDIRNDPRCALDECRNTDLRAFAGLPLRGGGDMLAVLGLVTRQARRFVDQADFLEAMAGQVGLGLQNVLLHQDLLERARELERNLIELRRSEAEQQRLQTQLLQAQKMEAIGTLAGGLAHDFNNLLTTIQGNASLARMELAADHPVGVRLQHIEQHVTSGVKLTRQLLSFGRGSQRHLEPTDLNELIKHHNQVFNHTRKEILIHSKFAAQLPSVEVDRGQMEQVLLNLYINAGQAMPGGGSITVVTDSVMLDEEQARGRKLHSGRYVTVAISDTGVGMDPETQRRIFEPFFTTRAKGQEQGTGLGLASVYAIIKNHGGFIDVVSQKGQGSTFTLYLPGSGKAVGPSRSACGGALPGGQETILLVDDEEMVLDVAAGMLQRLGYRVITARSGQEAVQCFRSDPAGFDLVILDMIMPEMNGSQVCDALRGVRPDVRVMLSSGYSAESDVARVVARVCGAFIQKPFDIGTLAQKVRHALEGT
jgi:signal transduction histidine kinase